MITAITSILVIIGTIFILLGTYGVYKLPDFYCRNHALSKSMTLGIMCLLLADWVYLGSDLIGFKICAAIFFQLITIPVSGHLMSRVAYRKGIKRWNEIEIDDHRLNKK